MLGYLHIPVHDDFPCHKHRWSREHPWSRPMGNWICHRPCPANRRRARIVLMDPTLESDDYIYQQLYIDQFDWLLRQPDNQIRLHHFHIVRILLQKCHSNRRLELCNLRNFILNSYWTKKFDHVEHNSLPMVRRVSNNNAIVWPNSNTSGPCEASGLAPPSTQLKQLSTLLQVLCPRGDTAEHIKQN